MASTRRNWAAKSPDISNSLNDSTGFHWTEADFRQDIIGTWKKSDDDYSYYFCDGYLLFMRWKNVGDDQDANSSCWEIDIRNGMMQWNALRERDDESIYELNVNFTKVK